MSLTKGSLDKTTTYKQQPDAAISQANPVSATRYTVLQETLNVRLLGCHAKVTWATTQPTPLQIIATIDDVEFIFSQTNPVSNTNYKNTMDLAQAENAQVMTSTTTVSQAFLLEGKKVKIEAAITWATTQPTPLVARVRWAKL